MRNRVRSQSAETALQNLSSLIPPCLRDLRGEKFFFVPVLNPKGDSGKNLDDAFDSIRVFLYHGDHGGTEVRFHNPSFPRWYIHFLPPRFFKIRHYGILSNRSRKAEVALSRALIKRIRPLEPESREAAAGEPGKPVREKGQERCPWCGSFELEEAGALRSGSCPLPSVEYAIGSG